MATISTSFLHPNISQFQNTCSSSHASTSLKWAINFFSGDNYECRKKQGKVRLQLVRDSNVNGHTKGVEHKVELLDQGVRSSINGPENSSNQQEFSSKEGEDDLNAREHVDLDDGADSGIATQLEDRETDGQELVSTSTALKGTIFAGLLLVGLVGGFGAVSYIYREPINQFLLEFSDFLEGYGTAGYVLFVAVYAGLEILAIPAIPLTMTAGLLFGTVTGTIIVSVSGTIAATAAFLIARYLVRDRVLKLAEGNKKFMAIDKAIGENGFRVVALLRLSPLLPFSLGNYLYGLTSVKLVPYVLGSWLGMLPGTWAYVSAGAVGRAIIQEEANNDFSGGPEQLLTIGIGILVTVVAATYVTRLAKDAVKDIEE